MSEEQTIQDKNIKLVAHRGLSDEFPENTLIAFKAALNSEFVDFLEIDLHKTIDDQLVVIHDSTIDRTANGSAKVKTNTLGELQQYDYGYWKGIKYANQKLLILDDVLALIAQSSKSLMIEVKQPHRYLDIENILINKLKKSEFPNEKIAIQSFNQKFIKTLYDMGVPFQLGVLIDRKKHWYKKPRFKKISRYASFVNAHHSVISKHFVKKAHHHHLKVYAYTVNDTKKVDKLLSYGLDGIVSDNPNAMIH
ncbi:glycerophosphodiester phosphodiesterase [Staphylococcus sp. ACRSN]|uniref:glycerophosphodiester phosphodiesterase n=1 Tax=Staphylococcus sp. ACRSN TaxID=2918214 RepID=UPI001EF35217|nr:glycerophosphodiester phosphodiesterase family protein [Staphylococcus sp. ACRSN]MCG7338440.1 glycerophosphodiester phosphodiesterase [Staphylococcus sp. ACRSN]